MQKLTLLTVVFFLLLELSADAQDTIRSVNFYRIKTKTDSGWLVKDYTNAGQIKMSGLYSDDSLKVLNGDYRYYRPNGSLSIQCTYVNGKRNGFDATYYENGQQRVAGYSNNGQRTGLWNGYYASGKLAGKVVYVAGKETDVVFYNEDGTTKETGGVFQKDSEYPGGPEAYLKFVNKHLRYPEYAVKNMIQGTVVLQFRVLANGKIADVQVIKGVEEHIDAEAVRVLRKTDDWVPAMMAGLPVESYKKQPIVFSLQSN